MTIGIDASRPNEIQKTGTEWYAYHIIQQLKAIDQKNHYLLYSFDPLRDGLEKLPSNFKSRVLHSITDILWTQLRLSIEMLVRPPDVLFVPAHTIPLVHPRATVLTVHDLGFEHFPHLYKQIPIGPTSLRWLLEVGARIISLGKYGNSELDYHRWAMRFGIKHATRIIAISDFTKQDVVKRFGADPAKISIVPHAYDPTLYRPIKQSEQAQSKRVKSLRPYMLFVGRIEHKKNIGGLLAAYKEYYDLTKSPLHLVLIGRPGLGYEEFQQQIMRFPPAVQKNIHILGWTSEAETSEFYRFADLFVFPSYFEGFGIPVVQAMACGVPVICSNVTSLPEVAGEAAMLVDPSNPLEIAGSIVHITSKRGLRQTLIRKGLDQAKKYSWEKSARLTLRVIEEAVDESRPRS